MGCLNLGFAALGEALRAETRRRVAEGRVTGAGLARRSGVSQPQICAWLGGRRHLSPEGLDCVRCVLRLHVCELVALAGAARCDADNVVLRVFAA